MLRKPLPFIWDFLDGIQEGPPVGLPGKLAIILNEYIFIDPFHYGERTIDELFYKLYKIIELLL